MKRISKLAILLGVIITLSGCGMNPVVVNPPLGPNKDWAISISWQYDFTNFAKCSASVTKGCISNFTWGYTQGSTSVPLKTSATSVCSGSSQPQSCSDTANSLLGIGPVSFYAIANGVDNNGAAVSSTQVASPSQTVLIGNPAGVTATLN